jgi:hypothetical protein
MKREAAISLSIAVAFLAFVCPPMLRAAGTPDTQPTASSSHAAPRHEASMMVPAQVALVKALDSRKMHPGTQFKAVLSGTVHLKNGVELPHGTVLMGTVVTDNMQMKGTSRLALRFTEAKLKNGKTVPIKATIMGVAPPSYSYYSYDSASLNGWDGKTMQLDQVNALSGVDLHSAIARQNSGVFVSNKKDDVKLDAGSQMSLALAAQSSHQS